jgi:hypothetical protein
VSRSNDGELARTLTNRAYEKRTLQWDEALEGKVAALGNDQILAAMKKALAIEKISMVQSGDFAKVSKEVAAQPK